MPPKKSPSKPACVGHTAVSGLALDRAKKAKKNDPDDEIENDDGPDALENTVRR